jgi:hypothetical protein
MDRGFLSPIYDLVSLVYDWFASTMYTFGVATVMWAAIASAMWATMKTPQIAPLMHITEGGKTLAIVWPGTAIWIPALLFPLTSSLYLVFDLRLRRNQIQQAADLSHLEFVYFPGSESAHRQFLRMLRVRFREACQPWELAVFSLVAALIAFVGGFLVFWNAFYPDYSHSSTGLLRLTTDPGSADRLYMFAAFSGALAGGCIFILRKFRSFDVYPSTYLQAIVGFISGTLGGTFIGAIYPKDSLTFLAFAIGFLTSTNVSFLGSLLRRQTALITGTSLPEEIPGDLKDVIQNGDAIETLHNMSLYSIAELVKAEPLIIYLSMPQNISVINGWIDEGLVLYYFGPENTAQLAKAGLRRFTQLVELAVKEWPESGSDVDAIVWNTEIVSLKDSPLEQLLLNQISPLIKARTHNRLLGVLFDRYRDTFFPAYVEVRQH